LADPIRQISAGARQNSERAAREFELQQAHRKRQKTESRKRDLWLAAEVPQRFAKMPNFTREQLTACERIIDSFGTGAIWALLGEWGTGKTQMAAFLILVACKNLRSARFTTAIEFFVRLRSPYCDGSSHTDEAAIIRQFTEYDLLVIDDAHVRAESDFENRLLHHVIDKRHVSMRETILTSNQSEAVFCDTIGGAVIDRMCAAGGVIECNWSSFRGKEEVSDGCA
jgi:DNA replication protein DnaC